MNILYPVSLSLYRILNKAKLQALWHSILNQNLCPKQKISFFKMSLKYDLPGLKTVMEDYRLSPCHQPWQTKSDLQRCPPTLNNITYPLTFSFSQYIILSTIYPTHLQRWYRMSQTISKTDVSHIKVCPAEAIGGIALVWFFFSAFL